MRKVAFSLLAASSLAAQDPVLPDLQQALDQPIAAASKRLQRLKEAPADATVITAVDIIRGIALGMGMDLINVPGTTGYIDTDYDAKGRAAVQALDDYDVVVVHIEAPDESAHQGMAEEKMKSLERIDEAIVGPLLEKLRAQGEYRMLIAPDHATLVRTKGHDSEPPPFCYAGTGVATGSGRRFNEREAADSGLLLDPGHTLLERFLRA